MGKTKSLHDWLYNPSEEDTICHNPFHETMLKVYDGFSHLDPFAPDPDHIYTKISQLIKADLILLAGDVIYVRDGTNLHTLNEATSLLAYYIHSDTREARKASDILENNFQGYFPVDDGRVARNVIEFRNDEEPDSEPVAINLTTLKTEQIGRLYPEFGVHSFNFDRFTVVGKFLETLDRAVNEQYFFEKTLLYPFTQPYREKSHVLVGGGGNGKSMFMGLVQRLYGTKAYTDAPQPNFKGHDAAVISYNFVGKRVVTFNDVGNPSAQFLEWMKRMITGNLEVKTPSGAWLSVPCITNFLMETNHTPEILDLEAHRRRFIIREFPENFMLKDAMTSSELDILGERGSVTAGDIVAYLYLLSQDSNIDWQSFQIRSDEPLGEEDY